jgi:hypothetical protein
MSERTRREEGRVGRVREGTLRMLNMNTRERGSTEKAEKMQRGYSGRGQINPE